MTKKTNMAKKTSKKSFKDAVKDATTEFCKETGINPADLGIRNYVINGNPANGEPDTEVIDCSLNISNENETIDWSILAENMGKLVNAFVKTIDDSIDETLELIQETKQNEKVQNCIDSSKKNLKKIHDKTNDIVNNLKEKTKTIINENVCKDPVSIKETVQDNVKTISAKCLPTAKTIKEKIKRQFEEVQREQKRKEEINKLYGDFSDSLYQELISLINDEKYQSMTNDLDSDDAGIYIIINNERMTELCHKIFDSTLYTINSKRIKENILPDIAKSIETLCDFSSSAVHFNTNSDVIFKFWF